MTRPIVWATGTFLAIAIAASGAGNRIARASRDSADAQPARAASAMSGSEAAGDRTAIVFGDRRGHFVTEVSVEGRWVKMLVDTGASIVALTSEDAATLGIRPGPRDGTVQISTANGTVMAARARIREVRIGAVSVRDVDAVVMPPGRLGTSLLGMSFLRQLRSFEVDRGRLTLRG